MKKTTSLLLSLLLCFSLTLGAFAQSVTVTVDGVELGRAADTFGESESGLYVPFRAVLEAMGYGVSYDDETGLATGGTFADPEFIFTPGQEGTLLVDGTTYVAAEMLTRKNGLDYTVEYSGDALAYTNTYDEIQEGWYRIFFGGEDAEYIYGGYLTGALLPKNDVVETLVNDDGLEEKFVKTPLQQILASPLTVQPDFRNGKFSEYEDCQLWLIREVAPKRYAIINKATGLAADVNSWSRENEARIIQYTYAGGTNQQFTFSAEDEGYRISSVHSKLDIMNNRIARSMAHGGDVFPDANTVVQYSGNTSLTWTLELVEPYVNPVNLALDTGIAASMGTYIKDRFKDYFFTDVYFSRGAKAAAEAYLLQNNFAEADRETQKELVKGAMALPFIDLMDGAMSEKLTADYEIVSVEEKLEPRYDEGYNEIGEITYYVYTIAMECGGPDDIHTFTVETVDPDDEEHIRRVCEAIACFEAPVRKSLRHFYYTGEDYGTWNAWDGEVWNNTGEKGSVDYMVNMFSHELGHVIDSYFIVDDDVWSRALSLDIVPVSGYGQTDRWEDFGEFSQLYLLSRGDGELISAIEKVYPNRTKVYRAALYNLDNDYYADYKGEYEAVTKPIGDTSGIDEGMYYRIKPDYIAELPMPPAQVLTNSGGAVSFEDYDGSDGQLWQIYIVDDELICLYSKADGTSLTIPAEYGARAVSDDNIPTFIGPKRFSNGIELLIVSETGYLLVAKDLFHKDRDSYLASAESGSGFILTPVEKIPGIGDFAIRSGDKYLVPSSEDNGAPLVLSESTDMNLWHIYKLPNGVGYITNVANGLAVDISGESVDEGAPALAYTLSRNPNQTWLVIENENGTVSFKAQHSELYLAADINGNIVQSAASYEWTLEAV